MILKEYTDEQLKKELERRSQPVPDKPVPVDDPDWDPVIKTMEAAVNSVDRTGRTADTVRTFSDHVFRAAMRALYGPTWSDWWEARREDG